MTTIKNEVLIRVYVVTLLLVLAALAVFSRAFVISISEGKKWRDLGDQQFVKLMPIEPLRGNIFASDGSILATSLPFYEIRFDPLTSNITESLFAQKVDSLSMCLASISDKFDAKGWKDYLWKARKEPIRGVLIMEKATQEQYERMKMFPLFRLGKYKGGFIASQKSFRSHPFGTLALRTLGYVNPEDSKYVGLEGYYNNYVGGEQGEEMMHKVGRDLWLPMNDLKQVDPRNGDDLLTTLDVNIQDITQEALLKSIDYHNADGGCAIVMEVKTGAIKAISNFRRIGKDTLGEIYNDAINKRTEPGSTLKLASIMAMLEDDYVNLEDTVDVNYGKTRFFDRILEDAEKHGMKLTTVRHAFEMSSNVGISRLVQRFYGENKKAEKFIAHLRDFNLDKKTGIDLEGESDPEIKEAYNAKKEWSGITLPWMSIGYEMTLTPLQVLTFYNAVANDGMMMKPYLLSEVQRLGEPIKTFKPVVIKRRIASKKTITMAKSLLEGVVLNGTAKDLRTSKFSFAGKTGTAQVNYGKLGPDDKKEYQASFAGYFPAENPVYSCIVVVYNPKQYGFYGAICAGPVFREIADKAFTLKTELHDCINKREKMPMKGPMLPSGDAGMAYDIDFLLDKLNFRYYKQAKKEFAVLKVSGDSLKLTDRNIDVNAVPNVVGMRLKDALHLLENRGLKVGVNGYGVVRRQSIPAGARVAAGAYIAIALE